MEILLLALIPLVLLAGIVLFAVGNRGWNWGTITAGILVLLVATGYTVLAGMLAQRERGWRDIVAGYQAALAKERDALVPAGAGKLVPDDTRKSLTALADDKARWQRVRDRIDTWRGRHWEKATFEPPVVNADGSMKAGRVTIEDVEKLTINAGAEIYLFDAAPVEENGRFLGAFSVEAVDGSSLSVVPSLPPSEADKTLWRAAREEVTVYEDLPVDRWMAFHRTVTAEDGGETGPAASPEQRKSDPEEMLKHLEEQLAEVRQHAEAIPEDQWAAIGEGLENGSILPGTYWATVEFKEAHSMPRAKGDAVEFEAGQSATFDLATARKLQQDNAATIVSVERRRPLADAQTAIQGTEYRPIGGEGEDRPTIRIEGVAFIRRMLETDIAAVAATTARLQAAKTSADNQLQLQTKEAADLETDRTKWQSDADSSVRVTERFETRVAEAGAELSALETAIVELGRELAGASALLVGTIDAQAPPPAQPPAALP
ncbi:MAG: hypothetical protein ACKOEM_09595 [Planctomycetia bacterium]